MRWHSLCGWAVVLFGAVIAPLAWSARSDFFEPSHRLAGIGMARQDLTDIVLERRTELMIDTQTFTILRDPRALAGAERITSPKLQKIFQQAARQSGWPASLISAVAYLESWGEARAESPAGPKGIMQIAEATARSMGLQIIRATKYRVSTERRLVKTRRGKPVYKTVKVKTPYTVLVRDERFMPELAVPAAARYLARMEAKFGSRDWAIFAYHCGEGCVGDLQELVRRADGIKGQRTVAKAFFSCSPVHNRELYRALRYHMERDFSPTYWFRIMRAEQLLTMYQENPAEYRKLFDEYRYQVNPNQRAPHRLSIWLKADDLAFQSCDDLKREQGRRLVRALENPRLFGFSLRKNGAGAIGEADLLNQEYYLQASPAAIGTLAYLAFETRRLHEAMRPKGERFEPLEVTGLVKPVDYMERTTRSGSSVGELPAHCTGQVFDIAYSKLPPGEREALEFVLDDMGWDGYLGFVQEAPGSGVMHIGCAPSARAFFTEIFQEALELKGLTD